MRSGTRSFWIKVHRRTRASSISTEAEMMGVGVVAQATCARLQDKDGDVASKRLCLLVT